MTVTDAGVPVKDLNELEFVKGEIFANVWTTDYIARIDPATGRVTGWIDLRGLLPARERDGDAVLNGIAYDAATRSSVRHRQTLAEAFRDQADALMVRVGSLGFDRSSVHGLSPARTSEPPNP